MIVATRDGANREVRFGDLSSFIPPPGSMPVTTGEGWGSAAHARELSLTAVAAAVRLISETIGSFVMRVYEGDASRRQPLLDSPQAVVLQDAAEGYTSMDLWSDIATGVEVEGNSFLWKIIDRGKVVELFAFPPEYVRVYRKRVGGPKIIEARIGTDTVDITRDVIHVRGWSPCAGIAGISTLDLHARQLQGSFALETYRGRYFASDSTPNLVLTTPANLSPQQRADLRESWKARHQGPNGEKVGLLWGGLQAQQLTSNLQQSQMAELTEADVLAVARMFRIYPPILLASNVSANLPGAEQVSDLFLRFTLLSRIRRIERAVSSDRDLFPDRRKYARFDVTELIRGDISTTASKLHSLKQVGLMTANEGRAELGLPPVEDGDELQVTPVGGAPNQNTPAEPGFEEDPSV